MDIKNYYVEKGEGYPIILMHGNGEDLNFFEHQMDALADHYHVIAIDSRGHGKTERGEKPLTIRQMAEDLLNFIDEKKFDKIDILGFSDGANIAMIFAMKYPERVGKLVLNGGNLSPYGMVEKLHKAIDRKYRQYLEEADKDPEAKKKAELFALMIEDPNIKPEELKAIKAPTFVVAGTKDMITEEHTRLIAESIEGSKLSFIEGDHFVANKEPEAFNKELLDFLLA